MLIYTVFQNNEHGLGSFAAVLFDDVIVYVVPRWACKIKKLYNLQIDLDSTHALGFDVTVF